MCILEIFYWVKKNENNLIYDISYKTNFISLIALASIKYMDLLKLMM